MSGDLAADVVAGDHRALARAITVIEDRSPGYRDLVAELYEHAGGAHVVGVTGSPGAGKSTLVDKLAAAYRERDLTVGVIAIDPSSPYSGGAVLGDRIRMGSTVGDMDTFVRSMSTRGSLGGLSTATADAVTALDAFGKDRIVVETVGAGQSEVDVVRTADTVAVLVPPGSGDDVQMLKAGILEIGDVFVVNKADLDGADRTVQQLEEMLHYGDGGRPSASGHHGGAADSAPTESSDETGEVSPSSDSSAWDPPVIETVAPSGEGLEAFLDTLEAHHQFLADSRLLAERERARVDDQLRTLLRSDLADLLSAELEGRGGLQAEVDRILDREVDPYTVADEVLAPIRECVERPDD